MSFTASTFIERKKEKQLINKSKKKTNDKRNSVQNLNNISNGKPVSLVPLSLCHVEISTRDGNKPLYRAMLSSND